jgi:2-keto-4-pentenoate hydratase/2-oxohepta-3-ene-1,7-dioic acid hydratase in catechol pathway
MKTISLISGAEKTELTPSKIVCIGRNYVEHIQELANEVPDEMVVFFKPNSAISSTLNAQHLGDKLHYEAELSFLYQQGRFTAVALGLDLTKRVVQTQLKAKGLPWERAKAFNGSVLFSEFVSFAQENNITDSFAPLVLSLSINGAEKQQGGVALMMSKPNEILAELQTFTQLEDGDVVMTGTPKGVGIINAGDHFSGQISLQAQETPLVSCRWLAQ